MKGNVRRPKIVKKCWLIGIVIELLNPRWIQTRRHTIKVKRQRNLQEKWKRMVNQKIKKNKKQQQQLQKEEQVTLEHCFINSPNLDKCFANGDDEFRVPKQSPTKENPSLASCASNLRGSVSSDCLRKVDSSCSSEADVSPVRKRTSGRRKKKVRFTLPIESDIFRYSPQQLF